MKRKTLLTVLSLLLFTAYNTFSGNTESPYPADAEASFRLPALESYADQHSRKERGSEVWGVGKREQPTAHNPFPFGGCRPALACEYADRQL
jgi:hypothetical protein